MSIVAGLITDLLSHDSRGPREHEAVAATIRFAEATADPFDRHAGPAHITASAVIAGPRGTVLHVHRRSGQWMQPGGHIDPGESPATAALRESLEETGLHCRNPGGHARILQIDRHITGTGHTHFDICHLLIADDVEPAAGEGESHDVRWFEWAAARSLADDSLASALDTARAIWTSMSGGDRS